MIPPFSTSRLSPKYRRGFPLVLLCSELVYDWLKSPQSILCSMCFYISLCCRHDLTSHSELLPVEYKKLFSILIQLGIWCSAAPFCFPLTGAGAGPRWGGEWSGYHGASDGDAPTGLQAQHHQRNPLLYGSAGPRADRTVLSEDHRLWCGTVSTNVHEYSHYHGYRTEDPINVWLLFLLVQIQMMINLKGTVQSQMKIIFFSKHKSWKCLSEWGLFSFIS